MHLRIYYLFYICVLIVSSFKAPSKVTFNNISARSFAGHAAAPSTSSSSDVVIPDLVDTLEWVISSPPPIHQFAEPPVSCYYYFIVYFLNVCCMLLVLLLSNLEYLFL